MQSDTPHSTTSPTKHAAGSGGRREAGLPIRLTEDMTFQQAGPPPLLFGTSCWGLLFFALSGEHGWGSTDKTLSGSSQSLPTGGDERSPTRGQAHEHDGCEHSGRHDDQKPTAQKTTGTERQRAFANDERMLTPLRSLGRYPEDEHSTKAIDIAPTLYCSAMFGK